MKWHHAVTAAAVVVPLDVAATFEPERQLGHTRVHDRLAQPPKIVHGPILQR